MGRRPSTRIRTPDSASVAPVAARKAAVMYTRVSSRDQEREGFSIPSQQRLLRDYAAANGFDVVEEFTDVETAKRTGRQQFVAMIAFLKKRRTPTAILVEKTDRLYRNVKDWVTLDEMKVELHLVKESVVISEESRSSEKFMHGIKVLMAKNYVDNLSEEVQKGMREKAEEGHWPSSAPYGYVNRREAGRSFIAPDPERALMVRNLFELYDSGEYSIKALVKYAADQGLRGRNGGRLGLGAIHIILRNPIYGGEFDWGGVRYKSRDPQIVERALWLRVQDRLDGKVDTRPAPKTFAFARLMVCGHCGATVSPQMHKRRLSNGDVREYVHYRCAQICTPDERYINEDVIAEQLAERVVKPIQLDAEWRAWCVRALREMRTETMRETDERAAEAREIHDRYRQMIDRAYEDKLSGRIDTAYFEAKRREWSAIVEGANATLQRLDKAADGDIDFGLEVLELVTSAYDAYISRDRFEQRRLLDVLVQNCVLQGGEVTPVWREPWDEIVELASVARNAEGPPGVPDGPRPEEWAILDLNQ